MADFVINQKKIAKNTLFLYSRMFLTILVGFYSVRVIFRVLGIQDYGIYTISMGIVAIFSILCNAMVRTAQRFLSIAIEKDERTEGKKVFSVCFFFFLCASLVLILLAETVGLYFFKHKIQIPDAKIPVALFVYQMSIACVIVRTLTVPFMSSVIAKEKMSFFAKIGLLEAFQTLGISLLLQFCHFGDALKAYSIMMFLSLLVILICYSIYCVRNFLFCRLSRNMDFAMIKEIFQFSGWSLLGAIANLAKTQGINILLNVYHGVSFNSTWGVTTQVSGKVNNFINGFQQAFSPEILKSQSNEDKESFWKLLFSSAKYSFLLFWFICSPLLMNLTYVLQLWLGKDRCPPQIEIFIIFALIFYMADCFSGPLWTTAEAIGNIMFYQIAISGLMIGGVLVSFCLFSVCGSPAWVAMLINVVFNIFCLVFRIIYLKKKIHFPVYKFCKNVFLPAVAVQILSTGVMFALKKFLPASSFLKFISLCCILSLCNIVIYSIFGLNQEEKRKFKSIIQKKLGMIAR